MAHTGGDWSLGSGRVVVKAGLGPLCSIALQPGFPLASTGPSEQVHVLSALHQRGLSAVTEDTAFWHYKA